MCSPTSRRNAMIRLIRKDLIENTYDLVTAAVEHQQNNKDEIFETIHAWNDGPSYSGEDSATISSLLSDTVIGEKKAVENFIRSLPMRYALDTVSPKEVMLHMRLMALVKKATAIKSAVHIGSLSDMESVTQRLGTSHSRTTKNVSSCSYKELAFSPSMHGMGNLKIVTISCMHTIGLMELVMGMLVSGGSEILDCTYLLSSEKIMLIRSVVNVKGPMELGRLESNIDEFIRASRGYCSSSSQSLNEILPGNIGTIQKGGDQITTTVVNGGEEMQDDEKDNSRNFEQIEVNIYPPVQLKKVLSGDDFSPVSKKDTSTKKLRIKRLVTKISCPPVLVDDEDIDVYDEVLSPPMFYLGDHGLFQNVDVTGIIKSNASGVIIYRSQRRDDKYKTYAIKVARNIDNSRSQILEELKQEGCVASRLDHPNICKLAGMVVSPNFACLSYEYCPKGSLAALLQHGSEYDFLDIARDISNGMAYLHSMNIIHRDLKPDNVFIANDGRAKIADFGLSITDTGGKDLTGETGTYRWMAPEVIRHEKYSVASDTYSFGIMLWQLVTRNPRPFDSMHPVQTAFAVANGARPPIPDFVPEYISRVIKACWDTDQLCRPSFTYVSIALAKFGLAVNDKSGSQSLDCSYHSFRNDVF